MNAADDVKTKRAAMDSAQVTLNEASSAYSDAVNNARTLRGELDSALSEIAPGIINDPRVRVSQ